MVKNCREEKHLCQGLARVPTWKLTLPFSSQLSGGTLLGVGIWVKVDGESFLKIFGTLSSSILQVVNVAYLLIVIGAILLVVGFLGCYGAQKESKCLLMMVWTCLTSLSFELGLWWGRPDGQISLWMFPCGGSLGGPWKGGAGLSLPQKG